MDGEDILASIGYFAIDLVENATGGLGGGRNSGAHGFQAVVKIVGADIGGIDFAFRELDVKGCLEDTQRFQFIGRQVSSAIGNYFHQSLAFNKVEYARNYTRDWQL
jgi:hypothetical protein